jgi:hypothetical protein
MPAVQNKLITPQVIIAASATSPLTATTETGGGATPTLVYTAPTDGARITRMEVTHKGTNVASKPLWFTSPDGTTFTLVRSKIVAAYTTSVSVENPIIDFAYTEALPLFLKGGERLYLGTYAAIAAGYIGRVEGGAY